MTPAGALARLAAMDADELRFRARCETRKIASRLRHRVRPAQFDRRGIARILDPVAGPHVGDALTAARRGDFATAHSALLHHFATRESRWPVQAAKREPFVDALRSRFPNAAREARRRADRVVAGRHDFLGYRDVQLPDPPDWHADVIHRRLAPSGHWTAIPYLDPAIGDHKVIWEVNRHQHFLLLGSASWLTGDPRYRATFVAHLQDWIEKNPPLQGVNWTSMLELAFRALSWTWSIEFFAEEAAPDESPWLVDLLVSIDAQLTHVSNNLSRYFSPNTHLTGEALALYAVSLGLPELRRSSQRAAEGRDVLISEAARQINGDGGHAELSPHYHRYTTDFYLLALMLARASGDTAAATFEVAARRLAEYLRTIADDRGRLPLIGDDDGGQLFRFGGHAPADASPTLGAAASLLGDAGLAVSPPGIDCAWITGRPSGMPAAPATWGSRLLASSGYFIARWRDGSHMIFDAGPHGYLNGGHAHADALSIVLTVAGEPLLVDPGTATYVMDADLRARMRSARMHNTVLLNGCDPSLPRGPFHWARRTDARMLAANSGSGIEFAVGTHDGYRPVRHARAVAAIPDVGWLIVDRITGPGRNHADAWWHIHPSWRVSIHDRLVSMKGPSGRRCAMAVTSSDVALVTDPDLQCYAPEYGRLESGATVRSSASGTAPFTTAAFISAAGLPVQSLMLTALSEEAGPDWVKCPFTITGSAGGIRIDVTFPADPEARPSGTWPQPCIEQLVQSCAE